MRDDRISGRELRGLAPDDTAAFDQLFAAYCDPLLRFSYRYVSSWEEAEDVVQELFTRVWERWGELAAVEDMRAYLYTAARNRAMLRLRHRTVEARWRAQQAALAGSAEPAVRTRDPSEQLAAQELTAQVQQAIDGLPPRQRDIVQRRCQGESYKEIAAALGISINTVSIHLARAFERLRRNFPASDG